jgi:hypothetical protein
MDQIGKAMLAGGLVLALLGAVLWGLSSALPNLRLGRLPGDIVVRQPGFTFYLPITTMILASLLLTGIFWVVSLWMRR